MTTTIMAEREEELKSLLIKVKEESEETDLKLNSQKAKIMASGPNTSCQIYGKTVETVTDVIFLGSKITTDGDFSHEIEIAPWKKSFDKLNSMLESRDITLPATVRKIKAMVLSVIMYGYESWTIKKSEHQRIDAFELWYWRRLLRVSLITRRSNLSILKEINTEYSLEGLMLKLKLQYSGHLCRKPTHWKTP